MKVGFLGTFTGQFSHTGYRLAFLFRLLNLLQHDIRHLWILVQIVVDFGLDEIAYKLVDAWSCRFVFLRNRRPHVVRTQFGLGLTLEHRLFHIQCNGGYNPVTDVREFLVLVIELLNGTGYVFLQGTLMGSPLGGMLAVHKRVVFFSILIGMGESNFNVLALQVNNVIQAIGSHVVFQQVFQTMTGKNTLTVVHEGQPRIQISIVAKQGFYKLVQELITHEQRVVRFEEDVCTIFFGGIFGHIAYQLTFLERCPTHLTITETGHLETTAERIHRLDTYPVQTDTFLEGFGVVFTTGVQLTDSLDQFALRNTSAVVTDAYPQIVLYRHFDTLSGTHLELVDTIVHHFL